MIEFVVIFLIMASLMTGNAMNTNEFKEVYGDLCRNPLNLNKFAKLIEYRRGFYESEDQIQDCDHSNGFNYKSDQCQTIADYDPHYRDISVSGFLANDDKHVILFLTGYIKDKAMNISTDGTKRSYKFNSNAFPPKKFNTTLFAFWVKERLNGFDFTHNYQIVYNSGRKSSTTRDFEAKTEDQMIVKEFYINTTQIDANLKDVPKGQTINSEDYTIKDSYLIVCGRKLDSEYSFKDCEPHEKYERIDCQCSKDGRNQIIIYIVVSFWCLIAIVATKPFVEEILGNEKKEKRVFFQFINCNERNVEFKYTVVLRLSKGTDSNLTDVTIDVEFFTTRNDSIAPALRFKANVLESRPMTDVTINQWRLTKMPVLKKIQCNHSGGNDTKIVLLGLMVQCISGEEDQTIKKFKINKNIVRNNRQLPLKETKDGEEVVDEEVKPMKNIKWTKISLSFLEILWIVFLDISFIGSVCLCLTFNKLFEAIHNTIVRQLSLIFVSFLLSIVFHTLIIMSYKLLIYLQLSHESKLNSKIEKLCILWIRAYYLLSILIAIASGVYLCIKYEEEKDYRIYEWVCLTICSFALLVMVWVLASHSQYFFKKAETPSETEMTYSSVNSTNV